MTPYQPVIDESINQRLMCDNYLHLLYCTYVRLKNIGFNSALNIKDSKFLLGVQFINLTHENRDV